MHGDRDAGGQRDACGQREVHGREVRQTEAAIYRVIPRKPASAGEL